MELGFVIVIVWQRGREGRRIKSGLFGSWIALAP